MLQRAIAQLRKHIKIINTGSAVERNITLTSAFVMVTPSSSSIFPCYTMAIGPDASTRIKRQFHQPPVVVYFAGRYNQ